MSKSRGGPSFKEELDELKVTLRLENEKYLRSHPELKYLTQVGTVQSRGCVALALHAFFVVALPPEVHIQVPLGVGLISLTHRTSPIQLAHATSP